MSPASDELVTLADRWYAALNAADLEAFLEFVDEDVEFTSLVAEAEGATFRGHDGVRAWWNTIRGSFDSASWEVLDTQGSGSEAVAQIRLCGTIGGVPLEQTMWQAVRVRDGRVLWWAFFRSEHEALESLGLHESNLALSRHAAEAFNRRDLDAFLALQAPDVLGVPLATDMEGEYRGHGGTRRWWAAQFDSFPDLTIEIVDMSEQGDATVAALRMRGHGAGGSVPVDMEIWRVTRWRDGKCYWWGSYRSEADAVAAVDEAIEAAERG